MASVAVVSVGIGDTRSVIRLEVGETPQNKQQKEVAGVSGREWNTILLGAISSSFKSLPTPTMVSLPPELLGAIVAEIHSPIDLLRIREANSTLNEFATPLAFRSVVLANRDKSINNFRLLSTSRLAPLIREVVFQYMESDPTYRHKGPVSEHAPQGFDGTAFVAALGHFAYLDSLESLVLNLRQDNGPFKTVCFRGNNASRDIPGEIMLQLLIFKALSEHPMGFVRPLKSLTVDKFLPLPNPAIASPSVIALLSKLNHLAIKTTMQFEGIQITHPEHGQSILVPLFQREVVPTSLVSLELHHTNIRSADILIPIARFHLPCLERLSLQRTYFSEQGALESFIARHGATLIELKMFLCPMVMSTSSDSTVGPRQFRRWSQVWERFDRDLKVLRDLVVSERLDSNGVEDATYCRYLEDSFMFNAAKLEEVEMVEDDGALKQFEKNVESRLRP